jgi:hypothetical protein
VQHPFGQRGLNPAPNEMRRQPLREAPKIDLKEFLSKLPQNRREILDVGEHALKQDYKDFREASRKWNPLRQGRTLEAIRYAITGSHKKAKPQGKLGRIWGRYLDAHLKLVKLSSRATTYRLIAGWLGAKDILPEAVCNALAEDERMAGVGISEEKPFGKYTESARGVAATLGEEGEFDKERLDGILNQVLNNPEKKETTPHMMAAHNAVMKHLRPLTSKIGADELESGRRQLTNLIAYLLKGFSYSEAQTFEPLPYDLPEEFEPFIVPKSERAAPALGSSAPEKQTSPHGFLVEKVDDGTNSSWRVMRSGVPTPYGSFGNQKQAEQRMRELDDAAGRGQEIVPRITRTWQLPRAPTQSQMRLRVTE